MSERTFSPGRSLEACKRRRQSNEEETLSSVLESTEFSPVRLLSVSRSACSTVSARHYFVADAYYATGKIVRGLLDKGNHLVTRVKSTSVAFFPPTPPDPRKPRPKGRPRKYGMKTKIAALLENADLLLEEASSPVYDEKGVILRFRTADLLWRPVGILVRFVAVRHPNRGTILLMSTDLSLSPLKIIELYGLRFKIEVSFKQALRVIGAYAYHFWMAVMTRPTPTTRQR